MWNALFPIHLLLSKTSVQWTHPSICLWQCLYCLGISSCYYITFTPVGNPWSLCSLLLLLRSESRELWGESGWYQSLLIVFATVLLNVTDHREPPPRDTDSVVWGDTEMKDTDLRDSSWIKVNDTAELLDSKCAVRRRRVQTWAAPS